LGGFRQWISVTRTAEVSSERTRKVGKCSKLMEHVWPSSELISGEWKPLPGEYGGGGEGRGGWGGDEGWRGGEGWGGARTNVVLTPETVTPVLDTAVRPASTSVTVREGH